MACELLAVLSVIFFHAEFSYNERVIFPGGFLGVDIFFVISGYLITSLIIKEIKIDQILIFLIFMRDAPGVFCLVNYSYINYINLWFFLLSSAEYVD